jgi:FAD:protein FMN transferase
MAGCLLALSLMITSSVAAPATGALTRFTYTQYHMGVDARLVVYAPDRTTAEDACAAAFARIAALDSIMSDYQPRSELMRLCARSGGLGVGVSPDLFVVLKRAQEVSRRSGGAFDITAGPLIALWRRARKSGVLPKPAEIRRARKLVGWQKLQLDARARTARLTLPGMKLDLGGIAKGYAVDEAQRVLNQHGITRALVEMGGDIVVSGPPPDAEGWAIRVPNAGDDRGPGDLRFTGRAISTSGDTEQFAVIAGRRYSHVVDPRTGQALTNRVQVTVIASDGLTSDPLSTALTIVGREGRSKLLQSYPGTKAYVRVLEFTTESRSHREQKESFGQDLRDQQGGFGSLFRANSFSNPPAPVNPVYNSPILSVSASPW